jgi:hypothetical protein
MAVPKKVGTTPGQPLRYLQSHFMFRAIVNEVGFGWQSDKNEFSQLHAAGRSNIASRTVGFVSSGWQCHKLHRRSTKCGQAQAAMTSMKYIFYSRNTAITREMYAVIACICPWNPTVNTAWYEDEQGPSYIALFQHNEACTITDPPIV